MGPIAILIGVLLSGVGVAIYVISGMEHITPLMPTFFGIPLILLGVLALNEKMRMHAMHGAAVLGLLGVALPLGRLIYSMTTPDFVFGLAAYETIIMAVLCGGFLGLCVKSFIDARVARKQKEGQAPATGGA